MSGETALLWLSAQDPRRPTTGRLIPPEGLYLVGRVAASAGGYTDGPTDPRFPNDFAFELHSTDAAKAAIKMDVAGQWMVSDWRTVPTTVPTGLVATCEWVIGSLSPLASP
jgi:hypothetical protein